ncbi:MAG TPA: cytochrome c [Pyrinomonadaceae bacterium]|nr:cytochrome c [Pyrinomonadaceae bacterium]
MRLLKLAPAALLCAAATLACTQETQTNTASNAAASSNASATPAPAARAAATPDPSAAARGTFSAACQRCHRPDGAGGPAEDDKGKKFRVPSLREGHAVTHTDEQLADKIANGDDEMPAFKNRLSPEQISELVRFIRSEFQGRPPASAP